MAGYLNLAADMAHNFTDGLAIGSSFLVSKSVGFVTTISVLVHELPHEIGDFAILIQSGCTAKTAILLQLTTAFGALLGACLSLLASGVGINFFGQEVSLFLGKFALLPETVTSTVLPFTAGGFIYIALSSVFPDLLADSSEQQLNKSGDGDLQKGWSHVFSAFLQSLIELLALCVGISFTIIIEKFM